MFPFLLPFLPPSTFWSYLSFLISTPSLYQTCPSFKPNSSLFPMDTLCFPHFGPWFIGFLCQGPKWCPSIKVQLRLAHLSSLSDHQIYQHPKMRVASLSQQPFCLTYHCLLCPSPTQLARSLFFASGLTPLLVLCQEGCSSKPSCISLHSGLCCAFVTSSQRPSRITWSNVGPPVPYLLSPHPALYFSLDLTPLDSVCLFLIVLPTRAPFSQGLVMSLVYH